MPILPAKIDETISIADFFPPIIRRVDFYEVFSLITMRTILLKEGLGLLALLSVMLVRAMISSQRF